MAAVPSDVYGHIYSFLVQQKLLKAAKAFRKEALVVSTILRPFGILLVFLSFNVSRMFIVEYPSIYSVHMLPTNFLVQDLKLVALVKAADIF